MLAIQKLLTDFRAHLAARGRSPHTVGAHVWDGPLFAIWFRGTNGRALTHWAITPIDVREYHPYLLTAKYHNAATVNRKFTSVSAFCHSAKAEGLTEANRIRGPEAFHFSEKPDQKCYSSNTSVFPHSDY